jgi:hypothetical protein
VSAENLHPAARDAETLLGQCDVRRLRRSGPGGQHRNKVETAVALHHRPTGVTAEANERRSQADNQRMAITRLKLNLAIHIRRDVPADGPPSELWQSRCRNGRVAVNPEHADFPAILAEALDVLFACEMEVKEAAERLGCTSSQLIKLLKLEPKALQLVNQQRRDSGKHSLK